MRENKGRVDVARAIMKDYLKVSELFKDYRRFVDVKWRADGEYMIPCPFHTDSAPSLSINDKQGKWYCFGCQKKGDAATALMYLAKAVDGISYSYPQAIDQLIIRYAAYRESLPFHTVMENSVSVAEIIERPRPKYVDARYASDPTMADVAKLMKKLGKDTFMDVAYASALMVARQGPEQIISFLAPGNMERKESVVHERVELTAADLLMNLDWDE